MEMIPISVGFYFFYKYMFEGFYTLLPKKYWFSTWRDGTMAPDHHRNLCPPRTAAGWQNPANVATVTRLVRL